jgi:hypothetical protein
MGRYRLAKVLFASLSLLFFLIGLSLYMFVDRVDDYPVIIDYYAPNSELDDASPALSHHHHPPEDAGAAFFIIPPRDSVKTLCQPGLPAKYCRIYDEWEYCRLPSEGWEFCRRRRRTITNSIPEPDAGVRPGRDAGPIPSPEPDAGVRPGLDAGPIPSPEPDAGVRPGLDAGPIPIRPTRGPHESRDSDAAATAKLAFWTSALALVGLLSTTVLAWRKDRRETLASVIELQKQALALEREKLALQKQLLDMEKEKKEKENEKKENEKARRKSTPEF